MTEQPTPEQKPEPAVRERVVRVPPGRAQNAGSWNWPKRARRRVGFRRRGAPDRKAPA